MAIVNDVFDRAREVLNDAGKVRWSDAALLLWMNDAIGLLRAAAPHLFIGRGVHSCSAGALQTLSLQDARELLGIVGVTTCNRPTLDAFMPGWESSTPGAAQHWMTSSAGINKFLLYPPSALGQSLTVDFTKTPIVLASIADQLPVSDDYVSPFADYVIGMAESKDATHVTSGRAQVFMQSFASKLGIKPAAQ